MMEETSLMTQSVKDVHPGRVFSQSEMDAAEVLLVFTQSIQNQEYGVFQWSGKRKRSHRLCSFDCKEGQETCREALGEDGTFVPHKHVLINTAQRKELAKEIDLRAKSPTSPLPPLQLECRTTAPQKNMREFIPKNPRISNASPPKDKNVCQAYAEASSEQDSEENGHVRSTCTTNVVSAHATHQKSAHGALLFSNEHGFIDAHGTSVNRACQSLEKCVDGVHAQLTPTPTDSNPLVDVVPAQTTTAHQCVDDVTAQLIALHHYMNNDVDGVPAQWNRCIDVAPFHPKVPPPQSLSHCVDGILVQHAHFSQSLNRCVDKSFVQLPCPLQSFDISALTQLSWPCSPYGRSSQVATVLFDRKFAFAEARRRRKEITRIKHQQARGSRMH